MLSRPKNKTYLLDRITMHKQRSHPNPTITVGLCTLAYNRKHDLCMSPKVIKVEPIEDYQLRLTFSNGEIRRFDVTPYLDKGIFTELQSLDYFQRVQLSFGSIQWPHEQDFSPDTLYLTSQPEEKTVEPISPSPSLQ
jgi:hypothetical protein